MVAYLIDANLPYYFSLWNNEEYIHVKDLDYRWSDSQIWDYAKTNNLTIVTKDGDFSTRILFHNPPPRIIHIKFGNMKLKEFHRTISLLWKEACGLSEKYKLVNVFKDSVEGIN